ncbi:hypothetical protein E5288_WYG018535 [Bos mutus]|uniref:Uncharacterized protein n=1 Tax=Bos mutus TaxID=72004 RepID=A0A6B0S420_9CETA|nr:hypothetical protein [Bos mutus]
MADLAGVTSGPLKTQLSNSLREQVIVSRDQKTIIRPMEASKVRVQRSDLQREKSLESGSVYVPDPPIVHPLFLLVDLSHGSYKKDEQLALLQCCLSPP